MNVLFFITPKSEVAYLYEDYSPPGPGKDGALPLQRHSDHRPEWLLYRNHDRGDFLWYIKDHNVIDLKETEKIPLKSIKRRWHNRPVNVDCEIEDLILTSMNQNFVPVIDDKKDLHWYHPEKRYHCLLL